MKIPLVSMYYESDDLQYYTVGSGKKKNEKIIIWNNFERTFARNCKKVEFYFQSDSVKNNLMFPKTKSATELFPIIKIDKY